MTRLEQQRSTYSVGGGGWRRILLLAIPVAALAFFLGVWLDPLSGQGTVFDQWTYPAMSVGLLLLELVLWRRERSTNWVTTSMVLLSCVFFLSKLIYVLYFLPPGLSIQAEMTESFFWIPAVYMLALLIPNLKAARVITFIFFAAMTLVSVGYAVLTGWTMQSSGVLFALIEMLLANLTLLTLTQAFIGYKDRLSAIQAQADALEQLVHTDLLTGLPSRLRLEQELGEAVAHGEAFTLLFIDVDGFKMVNDTLGHSSGDQVLREFAGRLRSSLRAQDLAARIGGDEFVVILQGAAPTWAAALAQRLLAELARPFTVRGQQVQLSASIGISVFPEDSRDAETLLRHADAAMYQIKRTGRNGVRRFDAALDAELERTVLLTREFQFALAREQLTLVFQPIYHLETGEMGKVEALLRWTHPEFGMVSPAVFIPIAESSGQIMPVGRWVLERACVQARCWREDYGWAGTVTVNVSSVQFAQPGFVDEVKAALLLSGLPAHKLELELTEGAVMQDPALVQAALRGLRRLGVEITIDDFGTGYSSLAYLRDLPIGCVKIDRSFIEDIASPRRAPQYAVALITAIVGIARTLDLQVVAEGVETAGQLEAVRSFGCDFGQGYYFARPLDAASLTELLDRGQPEAATAHHKRLN
ncbi:putative bifunctional diguanylate cyclase/phosphodiesterase [Deinococcus marmoris]|uniref:Diguanylate cyclase/phosphodiesterase (GGDEF & EAL domains) with PAS/PAC sensor(S) n=1 Tax=Deinococcus marmoris TaxID=249408 RepID=A0A1U7NXX7_9DEIO|nr:EAL domain-containing protein [Deinococcus marmoris]OLV17771.1 diguanylate cyclase/phosphodiesterase (GGDEF & EAL domains) with PAS/PAC sensor(s) [Deinococcus marmoris]